MTDPKIRKKIANLVEVLDDEMPSEEDGREAVARLGLDTKAWAAEIRSKIVERGPAGRSAKAVALPLGTPLGDLRLAEVLDASEEPRLIIARSRSGAAYLALRADVLGSSKDEETWRYVMLSETRLEDLRNGSVSVRSAFLEAEDRIVARVGVPSDGTTAVCTWEVASEVDQDVLPPEEALVATAHEFTPLPPHAGSGGKSAVRKAVERIYVDRTTRGQVLGQDKVAAMWTAWFECRAESLRGNGFRASNNAPEVSGAAVGSFSIDLPVPSSEVYARCIAGWQTYVGGAGSSDARARLVAAGIDSSSCELLLQQIVSFDLRFGVTLLSPSNSPIDFEIDATLARRLLSELESTVPVLGTEKIPQADDLNRLIALVREIDRTGDVTPEALSVTKRQVDYYKHAARVLGLLSPGDVLSRPGKSLVAASTRAFADEILRVQFETSECGLAWCRWAGVKSLADVKPGTAARFLVDVVPSLAGSTSGRRRTTLENWRRTLFGDSE